MILDSILSGGHNIDRPFIVGNSGEIALRDLGANTPAKAVEPGEVVGLIGDIDALSVSTLLELVDRQAVIMPLTRANSEWHEYFFQEAGANAVIEGGSIRRIKGSGRTLPLIEELRREKKAGLILFTSGSTGKPKAILHDFHAFLSCYEKPRPALTTLNFLMFDHIGGLNTLFHTMYNGGRIVVPSGRDPESVARDLKKYDVELLPVTPTFLRLWHLAGIKPDFPALKIISYGTERMDLPTLKKIAATFPSVDIRQTYGMSELGILRLRNRGRDELWISIDRKSAEWKVENGELFLRSPTRMLGYLNAPDPFDDEGWYPTGDMVETDGEWLKLAGRKDRIINVGGLKVFPAAVEQVALAYDGIKFAKATAGANPLTGMHVELLCETDAGIPVDELNFRKYLSRNLPAHARPRRVSFGHITVSHRCKQL